MAAKARNEPEILTDRQKRFLDIVSKEPYLCRNYYFTGGTTLAAFYLHHRLSEDIDLFSEQEVHLLTVRAFIKKAQKVMGAGAIDYRQFLGLHSFQLLFSKDGALKIDFNYYPFPRIEKGMKYKNITVDSMLDIAVNKVHTIAMKPRARDFIDLFFLVEKEKYNIHDLLMKAKAKFDWHIDAIQLGSRLFQASDMTDYPRMLKPIEHRIWKEFFVHEARKLKKEILK